MPTAAALVELDPSGTTTGRFGLPPAEVVVIGRDPHCGLVITDPTVSRRHAELRRHHGELWLADLGSTGGTAVNGEPVRSPRRLSSGDRIRLGNLQLRYLSADDDSTRNFAATHTDPGARFDLGDQSAGVINNVGRDQHISYVQHVRHVQQQRESFAREIAATRTKARWLIWLGVLMTIGGLAPYVIMVLRFVLAVFSSVASQSSQFPDLSGVGFEEGLIGFGVAFVGMIMVVIGIVLHVIATSRRRRVDRELPLPPPPWPS